MATRLPEPEPWVRVAAVLAEAAGVSDAATFDVQAVAQAKTMRGVRHDWAGKPTITWSVAAELLASLRAEQARVVAAAEERLVEADRAFRAQLWDGLPADAIPPGMTGGQLLMASDPMRGSRRRSVVEDALAGVGTVYTPINEGQP